MEKKKKIDLKKLFWGLFNLFAFAVVFFIFYEGVREVAIVLFAILSIVFFILYRLHVKTKTLGLLSVFVLAFVVFILSISFFTLDVGIVSGQSVVVRGAHRGNSHDYLENTLPAFQSAIDNDMYKFIEFDVQYTKDKKLIVHHGEIVFAERLRGILLQSTDYPVRDLTYDELLEASGYHIPLYEEVLDLVGGVKPINVEIKSQKNKEEDKKIVDFIVANAKEKGILTCVMISSLDSDLLRYTKEIYPELKTGKIYYVAPSTFFHTDFLTSFLYKETENIKADYLLLHGANLRNYETIHSLLPENLTLIIWYTVADDNRNDEIYIIDPASALHSEQDIHVSQRRQNRVDISNLQSFLQW